MGSVTWTAYNSADTTTATSVADAGGILGNEIDNSSSRYRWGDFVVSLSSAVVAAGLDARVDCYLIPTYDGTNYPNPGSTASTMTGTYYVGSISSVETVGTVAVTNFQQGMLRSISIPPTKFKMGIVNELGVTTATTTSFSLYRYTETVA